jgi:membrane protein YqaA with SNARE-associated domain
VLACPSLRSVPSEQQRIPRNRRYEVESAMILGTIEAVIEGATGPAGLVLIFIYSVLVAFILPLPGELVLLPAPQLAIGLSQPTTIAVVVLVSAVGKALGSVWALRIGRSAVTARPAQWFFRHLCPRYDSSTRAGFLRHFIRRYEYVGLAALLSIPLMPDTAVVYAFSVIESDERLFALATFVGTIIRLSITLALAAGILAAV